MAYITDNMVTEQKATRADNFKTLKNLVEEVEVDVETRANLVEFLDNEIAKLERRAEKARERRASKKTEGDELREKVSELLTDEYQSLDDFVMTINDEEVTRGKVSARLTQLINQGVAEKAMAKGEGSKRFTVYRLAQAE